LGLEQAQRRPVREHQQADRRAPVPSVSERPAVQRGRMFNRIFGEPSGQLHERHDPSDFTTKTRDKLTAVG
jgi:GST-like protein